MANKLLPEAFSSWSSHTKVKILYLLNNLDRNQTDSHRFEPNSRNILIGEQPNLCYQLQQQEMSSRHRGDKQKRRYDRLIFIILLSPKFLLSADQIKFHSYYLVH